MFSNNSNNSTNRIIWHYSKVLKKQLKISKRNMATNINKGKQTAIIFVRCSSSGYQIGRQDTPSKEKWQSLKGGHIRNASSILISLRTIFV